MDRLSFAPPTPLPPARAAVDAPSLQAGSVVGGAEIEYYNFDFQDTTYRNEVAKAGDTFTTTCWYDHRGRGSDKIVFGLGSSDEMCIDFIGYWPKSALSVSNQHCGFNDGGGVLIADETGVVDAIERRFGTYMPTTVTSTTASTTARTTATATTTLEIERAAAATPNRIFFLLMIVATAT